MKNDKVAILGISIDNLTMDTAVANMLELIEAYSKDRRPRYVGTLNVDFLVNSLSWRWGRPRHAELLHILRTSDIITADGMPIVWLSKLLGSPLKQRITGTDLFPRLLTALANENKAIYLVGGEAKMAKVTSVLLEAFYPGLTVAGIATPQIDIDGERLDNTGSQDAQLAEQINSCSPDLLFISLGNPKQEVWFDRIKHRLQVPLSIGIGGTLDITFGPIGRAPKWMQKSGLEWLYRLVKEPGRLWRRYVLGGMKFLIQAVPLLLYHTGARVVARIMPTPMLQPEELHPAQLFFSDNFSIAALALPARLEKGLFTQLNFFIEEAAAQDAVILDFTKIYFLTPKELSTLVTLWETAISSSQQLFAYGISPGFRFFLKIHRLWDLFLPYQISTTEEILACLPLPDSQDNLFTSIQQYKDNGCVSFLGNLHNGIDYVELVEKLIPIFNEKEFFLDLTYCFSIENSGFSFLLNLHNTLQNENKLMKILGATPTVRRQFALAKIDRFFQFI